MLWTKNIYDQINKPIGQTTYKRLIIAFILLLLPALLFTYIADEVHEGETTQVDSRVLLDIYHHSTPILNQIVLHTTDFGGVLTTLSATLVLSIFYAYRRKWQAVTQILVGVLGAGLINFILKISFERSRPDLWQHLIQETSYSFPSGHAMLSSALALSIVAVMWHTRARVITIIFATLYILYIGFTRLYLGVHYPTDVIAGWSMSLAWVFLVATILGSVRLPFMVKKTES